MKILAGTALAAAMALASVSAVAQTTLYDQNFESPNAVPGYVNNGQDVSGQTVNSLYGGQPAGFQFAQDFTVETLRIGGNLSFGGQGYDDPAGIAGQYVIGMLSSAQDDLLGLSFNVGSFDFLNLRADVSSIDLSCCGGFFVPIGDPSSIPIFRFSLFDNPAGGTGVGTGLALDSFDVTGLINPSRNSLLFYEALGGLDATGSTNGNVILRIDLLQGGYAVFDNLRVVASDVEGDVGAVPEPSSWAMMILGFWGLGASLRLARRNRAALAVV